MKNTARPITIEEQLEKPKSFIEHAKQLYKDRINASDVFDELLDKQRAEDWNKPLTKRDAIALLIATRNVGITEYRYNSLEFWELIYALNDKLKAAETRIEDLEKARCKM